MRKLLIALAAAVVLVVAVAASAGAVIPGKACDHAGAAGISNAETNGGNVTCAP